MTKSLPTEIPPALLAAEITEVLGAKDIYISYLKHVYEASQQALEMALRENRVREECLQTAIGALEAIKVLKWYVSMRWLKIHIASALDEIETRLAELEPGPEEETGD